MSANAAQQDPVVVIGAGIAGLTCALALKRQGKQVKLLELSARAGGLINSVKEGPYLLEVGPNTVPDRHGTLQALIDELELRDELIEPNHKANKRYIVRDGKMVALPRSPKEFLTSEFLSPAAKLRLVSEPLASSYDRDEVDESLAHFVRRRFGQEVVDYALNPFIAGTYGGQPEHLSLEHTFGRLLELEREAGSILWGGLRRRFGGKPKRAGSGAPTPGTGALINFRDGEQTLTDAMAARLRDDLILEAKTTHIKRDEHERWHVRYERAGATHELVASCVVFATPAWAIEDIKVEDQGQAVDMSALGQVRYEPMSVCVLAFKSSDLGRPLDGFGVLIPQVEEMNTLGAIFASTIFEGRAPQDHSVMIVFIGGARAPERALLSEQERLELAMADMDQLIGIRGEPLMVKHHTWPRGIPQYEVGYGRTLAQIEGIEAAHPGLLFTGNYLRGISVSDTVHHADQTHQRVLELERKRDARALIQARTLKKAGARRR